MVGYSHPPPRPFISVISVLLHWDFIPFVFRILWYDLNMQRHRKCPIYNPNSAPQWVLAPVFYGVGRCTKAGATA